MSAERVERRLAAILAADVAGYSRLMEQDETGTLARLRTHRREVIDPKIAEHKGRIVKTTGDGMLVEFPSVVEAVTCAIGVQEAMAERNISIAKDKRIEFRIGINLGDIIIEEDDIFGDGVNLAACLEGLAEPGGICVSRVVRDQVRDRLDLKFEDMGEQSVKNIARPVRVYALRPDGLATPLHPGLFGSRPRWGWATIGAAVAVAVLVIVFVGLAWWLRPAATLVSRAGPAHHPTAIVPAATEISPMPIAPRLSIVVLPFSNFSNQPDQQYFADGITEDLTTDLSRIADMVVISRDSAFAYKDKSVNAKEIGRELGVRYVLEGSVQRSGNDVRVNAQLIDAESGAHLWADRFDRDIGDLFALQNEITARIAGATQSQLAIAEARRPIAKPDALDYILRGRAVLTRPISKENYEVAVGDFETALKLDPDAADAAAWLAIALVVRVTDELSDAPDVDLRRAERLARQALAAAPNSAMAHYAEAQVLRAQSHCRQAITEYETALSFDRSRTPAYAHIGWCKFLTGSVHDAIPYFERAIRLDPFGPGIAPWYGRVGVMQLLEGHTEEAIASLEKAQNGNARLPFVHAYLAAAYALKGQTQRARTELAEARARSNAYTSLASVAKSTWYDDPKIRAMAEATYFKGLRQAGVPEE